MDRIDLSILEYVKNEIYPAITKATTYCVYLFDSSAVEGLWPDLNRSRNFSLVSVSSATL